MIEFKYNDGGRKEAGYPNTLGECVCRSIVIATGLPYAQVMERINEMRGSTSGGCSRKIYDQILYNLDWVWKSTIVSGAVALNASELPDGAVVCVLDGHVTCVVDGVLQDISDCSQGGTAALTGYWTPPS